MMRYLLLAALALGLLTGSAEAVNIIGRGNSSCGKWTTDRRNPEGQSAMLDGQWVLGFLSGVGDMAGFDPLHGVDADAVWSWMDNYCLAHPLGLIMTGGEAFIREHPR